MLVGTAEDLAGFVGELKKESDRGVALVGAAFIDSKLRDTIFSFCHDSDSARKMLDGGSAPLGTFSSRILAALSLGLIDGDEYAEINLIRKIRNAFAHELHGISFQSKKIQGLCSSLKRVEAARAAESRDRFMHSVVGVILKLYHRPDWASKCQLEKLFWHQLSPLQIDESEARGD